MEITPLGHASFKIRGKTATVITDPFDSELVGIKFPKGQQADIVTVSHDHPDHNFTAGVTGNFYVVRGPGEYDIKGVSIIGISTFHDKTEGSERGKNTAYRLEIDGVAIVHLGDLGHKLTDAQVDILDGVDILLVPVGGFYTIDPSEAVGVVKALEPKIVIPMHYGGGKLAPVTAFLKEMGKEVTPVPKLTISKDKLPPEMQVVVLE